MIFEDHSGAGAAGPPAGARRTSRDILDACVIEADRHAKRLDRLDAVVGAALAQDNAAIDPRMLQNLDLLRQEAEGLARILELAISAPTPGAVIEDDAILKSVPLAAQRARLTAG